MDEFPHIAVEHKVLKRHVQFKFNPERCRQAGFAEVPNADKYEVIKLRRVYHFNKDTSNHVVLSIPKPVFVVVDKDHIPEENSLEINYNGACVPEQKTTYRNVKNEKRKSEEYTCESSEDEVIIEKCVPEAVTESNTYKKQTETVNNVTESFLDAPQPKSTIICDEYTSKTRISEPNVVTSDNQGNYTDISDKKRKPTLFNNIAIDPKVQTNPTADNIQSRENNTVPAEELTQAPQTNKQILEDELDSSSVFDEFSVTEQNLNEENSNIQDIVFGVPPAMFEPTSVEEISATDEILWTELCHTSAEGRVGEKVPQFYEEDVRVLDPVEVEMRKIHGEYVVQEHSYGQLLVSQEDTESDSSRNFNILEMFTILEPENVEDDYEDQQPLDEPFEMQPLAIEEENDEELGFEIEKFIFAQKHSYVSSQKSVAIMQENLNSFEAFEPHPKFQEPAVPENSIELRKVQQCRRSNNPQENCVIQSGVAETEEIRETIVAMQEMLKTPIAPKNLLLQENPDDKCPEKDPKATQIHVQETEKEPKIVKKSIRISIIVKPKDLVKTIHNPAGTELKVSENFLEKDTIIMDQPLQALKIFEKLDQANFTTTQSECLKNAPRGDSIENRNEILEQPIPDVPIPRESQILEGSTITQPQVLEEHARDGPIVKEPEVLDQYIPDGPTAELPQLLVKPIQEAPNVKEPLIVEQCVHNGAIPKDPEIVEHPIEEGPVTKGFEVVKQPIQDSPIPKDPEILAHPIEEGGPVTKGLEVVKQPVQDCPIPEERATLEHPTQDDPFIKEPQILEQPIQDVPVAKEPLVLEQINQDSPTIKEPPILEQPIQDGPVGKEPQIMEQPTKIKEPQILEQPTRELHIVEQPIQEQLIQIDSMGKEAQIMEQSIPDSPTTEEPLILKHLTQDGPVTKELQIVEQPEDNPISKEPPVLEQPVQDTRQIAEQPTQDGPVTQEPQIVEQPIQNSPMEKERPILEQPTQDGPVTQELQIVKQPIRNSPMEKERPILEEPIQDGPMEKEPLIMEHFIQDGPITTKLQIMDQAVENRPMTKKPPPIDSGPNPKEAQIAEHLTQDGPVTQEPQILEQSVQNSPIAKEPPILEQPIQDGPVEKEPLIMERSTRDGPIIKELQILEQAVDNRRMAKEPPPIDSGPNLKQPQILEQSVQNSPIAKEPPILEQTILDGPMEKEPLVKEHYIQDGPITTKLQIIDQAVENRPMIKKPPPIDSSPNPKEAQIAEHPTQDGPITQEPQIVEQSIRNSPIAKEPPILEQPIQDGPVEKEPLIMERSTRDGPIIKELQILEQAVDNRRMAKKPPPIDPGPNSKEAQIGPQIVEQSIRNSPIAKEPSILEQPIQDGPMEKEHPVMEHSTRDGPIIKELQILEQAVDNRRMAKEPPPIDSGPNLKQPQIAEQATQDGPVTQEPQIVEQSFQNSSMEKEPPILEQPIQDGPMEKKPHIVEQLTPDGPFAKDVRLFEQPIQDGVIIKEPQILKQPIEEVVVKPVQKNLIERETKPLEECNTDGSLHKKPKTPIRCYATDSKILEESFQDGSGEKDPKILDKPIQDRSIKMPKIVCKLLIPIHNEFLEIPIVSAIGKFKDFESTGGKEPKILPNCTVEMERKILDNSLPNFTPKIAESSCERKRQEIAERPLQGTKGNDEKVEQEPNILENGPVQNHVEQKPKFVQSPIEGNEHILVEKCPGGTVARVAHQKPKSLKKPLKEDPLENPIESKRCRIVKEALESTIEVRKDSEAVSKTFTKPIGSEPKILISTIQTKFSKILKEHFQGDIEKVPKALDNPIENISKPNQRSPQTNTSKIVETPSNTIQAELKIPPLNPPKILNSVQNTIKDQNPTPDAIRKQPHTCVVLPPKVSNGPDVSEDVDDSNPPGSTPEVTSDPLEEEMCRIHQESFKENEILKEKPPPGRLNKEPVSKRPLLEEPVAKMPRLDYLEEDEPDFKGFTREEQNRTSDVRSVRDSDKNSCSAPVTEPKENVLETPTKLNGLSQSTRSSYKCNKCDFRTCKLSHLKVHVRTHVPPFWCSLCSEMFLNSEELEHHVDEYHGVDCVSGKTETKAEKFDDAATLGKNLRNSRTGEKPPKTPNKQTYKCGFCDYSSSYIKRLQHHVKVHMKEQLYACDRCNYTTLTDWMMERHKKAHVKDAQQYECDECGFMSVYRDQLEEHMQLHSGQKVHKCDKCSFSTAHLGYFNAHVGFHQPKTECPSECGGDDDDRKELLVGYTCRECGFYTTQHAALFKHARKEHGHKLHMEVLARLSNKEIRMCTHCGFMAGSKEAFDQHWVIHADIKPQKCELCDFVTDNELNLKVHEANHSNENVFRCTKCTRKCTTLQRLKDHTLRVHNGDIRTVFVENKQ